MDRLEKEILCIIDKTIEGKYIGKLKVEHNDDWYTLLLYMNREMTPLCLSYQGTEEQFKNFIYNEIKSRKLEKISYWDIMIDTSHQDDDESEIE